MVLTGGMITAFFENPDQMGIPHETVLQLVHEGISDVQALADFQPDTIDKISANLRKPATRVADTSANAAAGATLALPPFVFSAMSQKKLTIAAELLRYYGLVGRPTTAANILWDPVIKDFRAQWEFLVEKKKKVEKHRYGPGCKLAPGVGHRREGLLYKAVIFSSYACEVRMRTPQAFSQPFGGCNASCAHSRPNFWPQKGRSGGRVTANRTCGL